MYVMPALALLLDSELLLEYYELHDRAGCADCGAPGAAGISPIERAELLKNKELAAEEIFRRNYTWLYYEFARYRAFLTEEPQALAVITIYKALRTACRRSTRYDGVRPFRVWLKSIARRVRLDHSFFRAVPDAELILKFRQAKDEKTRKQVRAELDERYRQILTDWFRKGMKAFGLKTRPEDVKALVDETFAQVFARVDDFDPEETAFIIWLSRIAKAVLGWRAFGKLPDVPEYAGREHVALDEELEAEEDPPDQAIMTTKLTDPRFIAGWQGLNLTEQRVLWMVDVQGLDPKQAAKRLSIALGTVNNNLSGGRRKLREGLL